MYRDPDAIPRRLCRHVEDVEIRRKRTYACTQAPPMHARPMLQMPSQYNCISYSSCSILKALQFPDAKNMLHIFFIKIRDASSNQSNFMCIETQAACTQTRSSETNQITDYTRKLFPSQPSLTNQNQAYRRAGCTTFI